MLGLTISICRSCWAVLGSVSTPCLAHSGNTFIANVLKYYHPHHFSRDQRGEGGFLCYPGEVIKWKKQPSQWLLPSFGSGDTWGRQDGKIHRWTLESNTKSSAPAPMLFCLFFLWLITLLYHPCNPAILWDWGATKEYGIRCQHTFWRTLFFPISVVGEGSVGLPKK